jgi:hypothetical protein
VADPIATAVTAQAKLATKSAATLLRQIVALWAALGPSQWWNDDLVAGNAAASATLADAALAHTRRTERSFQTAVMRRMDVSPRTLPPLTDGYPRANVTPFEVYQRPAKELRFLQAQGLSFDEAHQRATRRAQNLVDADLRRARFDESRSLYSSTAMIVATRRVIHPELSQSGTCGLCIVAASQVYGTSELQGLHDGCNCTQLPVTGKSDPGLTLNRNDLDEIYAAAGGNDAGALLNTRIQVVEHGELGPVLIKQGDHFRTPEEAGLPSFVPSTPETIRAARAAELEQITTALPIAEANYAQLIKTVEPGQGEALQLWLAAQRMRDRVRSLQIWLSTH